MRTIKHPAIYKHFKNKFYATMGVSRPLIISELDNLPTESLLEVEHTETGLLLMCYYSGGNWYHNSNLEPSEVVIYKSLYDNHIAYARELSMFLSKVDKSKYPEAEQEFRFEEVN